MLFIYLNESCTIKAPKSVYTRPRRSTGVVIVGVCTSLSRVRGWSRFRQSGVLSSRPPAGNASR